MQMSWEKWLDSNGAALGPLMATGLDRLFAAGTVLIALWIGALIGNAFALGAI